MSDEKLSREEQKQLTRQKILDVAVEMLLDPNFTSLNTNELAKQADVSKGTVFHHFETKDQLILEVFKIIYEKQIEEYSLHDHSEDTPLEQLKQFTRLHIEFITENVNLNSLLFHYLSELSSNEHLEYMQSFLTEMSQSTIESLMPIFVGLGWDNSDQVIFGISRIYIAILDGLGLQVEMSRWMPESEFVSLDTESLVDIIVTLFDRRSKNESTNTN